MSWDEVQAVLGNWDDAPREPLPAAKVKRASLSLTVPQAGGAPPETMPAAGVAAGTHAAPAPAPKRRRLPGARDYYAKGASPDNDEAAWLAEVWFADRYGLPQPPRQLTRPDGGVDFVVGGDRRRKLQPLTLDVKWSRHEGAHLIYPAAKRLVALAYVLVVGPPDKLHLAGYAWLMQLRGAPVRDWDGVPCLTLAQHELHPPAAVDVLVRTAQGGGA